MNANAFEVNFSSPEYSFPFVFVEGTGDSTYLFGDKSKLNIHIEDLYVSKYPVTQLLWQQIMGTNPSYFKGENRPVECVSFDDVTGNNGFLQKLNAYWKDNSTIGKAIEFRLLSETEWEYAARGGVHWRDDFLFSGSNDLSQVGWFSEIKSGTQTHPVGEKLPNQLGLYDMCGNVWEWCEDFYQPEIHLIPKDGTPYLHQSEGRILRGGCHHNAAIHCTVSKRYQIIPKAKDECIGFRIAAAMNEV